MPCVPDHAGGGRGAGSPTVPGLARGLAVLCFLARSGPSSLAQISGGLGFAKSSVLRLLHTLAAEGIVSRGPTKERWCALAELSAPPAEEMRARVRPLLAVLARTTGEVAEFWLPEARGLRLIERFVPTGRRDAARGRVGWLRRLSELDAVSLAASAAGLAEPSGRLWGEGPAPVVRLDELAFSRLRARVRREGLAADPGPNHNGIRRWAVATEVGVLALACCGAGFATAGVVLRTVLGEAQGAIIPRTCGLSRGGPGSRLVRAGT